MRVDGSDYISPDVMISACAVKKSVRLLSGWYKPEQLKWCKCMGRVRNNTSTPIERCTSLLKTPWEIYLPQLDCSEHLKEAWFNCSEIQWWHCCVNCQPGFHTVIFASLLENSSVKENTVGFIVAVECCGKQWLRYHFKHSISLWSSLIDLVTEVSLILESVCVWERGKERERGAAQDLVEFSWFWYWCVGWLES